MKIGVLSDTHRMATEKLELAVKDLIARGAKLIVHCGDIEPRHWRAEIFGNLPVIVALTEDQILKPEFSFTAGCWAVTRPGQRIVPLEEFKLYVGHQRSMDFLHKSEGELKKVFADISQKHDGVRWAFAGHTHHQI